MQAIMSCAVGVGQPRNPGALEFRRIAIPAAMQIAASVGYNMMAVMTAAYGFGQIAGPLVSNALLSQMHSFNPPLLAAGGALLAAALGCLSSSLPAINCVA
jgi:hypothetical protein